MGLLKLKYTLLIVSALCTAMAYGQSDAVERYQRCSVIHMMIEHPMYMFNEEIASAFKRIPLSHRFNDHSLGVKVVKFATQEFSDQQEYIASFIRQTKLGNRAVAKWFQWNKTTGKFHMDLVRERGLYDANAMDRILASKSIRGNAILQDAGENLIPNTYLLMSDICYTGKYSNKEKDFTNTEDLHKFDVTITTYIFQLNWNKETLYSFYEKYFNGTNDFVNQGSYDFIYRAKAETSYGEESCYITQSKLIERVVARCLDINIMKLQREYHDFAIRAPLLSTDPIQADIGLKEGVNTKQQYEVLEKETDKNGIMTFHHVGIIQPEEGKIKDNRYMAEEEKKESHLTFTTFKKVSGGDFYPGMLIRELK